MLTLDKFEEASERVKKVIQETKLIYSDYFSSNTGNKVYLKPENMQYTGAYKLRGAYYKISTLSDEEREKGLITASAGNHAQGVAYAAQRYGVKAVIVMPTTTPLIKVNRTKSYGAEVVLHGDVYDEACEYAYRLAEEHGVEPEGASCMQASVEAGKVVTLPGVSTIADGTAVKTPGKTIFPYIQKNLDGIVTVADDDLITAFLDMVENHKMIVENSGLLTVAALKKIGVTGKRVAAILSGGNMDVITMSSVVQQGLIFRNRIFTVSVRLPDKPGELCKVAQAIAAEQGNVIKLEHNQFVTTNRSAAVELRITMESFGTEHKNQIMAALEKLQYNPRLVQTNL